MMPPVAATRAPPARRRLLAGTLAAAGLLAAGCTRLDTGPGPRPATAPPPPAAPPPPPSALTRPPCRTLELGRSVEGRPLVLELLGDGPEVVFIFGGIHGDEPTSSALAHALAEHLRAAGGPLAGRTVAILAAANPDGLARGRRANARGVDLNRNFPAASWRLAGRRHGPRPASEPETRALLEAVETLRPARIVAIHSIRRGQHCNNFDGPARGLAETLAQHNGYPVRASMGYATPGSFGNWAGREQGIPTLTLELPRDLDAAACWRENAAALLAAIRGPAR